MSSDIPLNTSPGFILWSSAQINLIVCSAAPLLIKKFHYLCKSQCGDCVLAPGDSDRSSFIPASSEVEEIEVGSTELLVSREEEADEGRDTTMYFCTGLCPVSPGPLLDSSFTKGCKVDVALGTVLVTGEADWEELRVITWRRYRKMLWSLKII